MNGMKRIVLLFVVCFVLLVSGCGDSNQSSSTDSAQSPDTAQTNSDTTGDGLSNNDSDDQNAIELDSLDLKGYGNTPTNIVNQGLAAEYDGYVYHADSLAQSNLWRTPIDGGESELLLEGDFHNVNVNAGVVFFSGDIYDSENPAWGIFMMNIDGSGFKQIKEGWFENLILYDDYLYFTDTVEGGIYRMKYDGSEEKLLFEDVYSSFALMNNFLYVQGTGESNIYKVPLDGNSEAEVIIDDMSGINLYAANDYLFYSTYSDINTGINKHSTLTGASSIFLSEEAGHSVSSINTDGELLYYYWSGVHKDKSDSGIYKINPDGSGKQLIMQSDDTSLLFNVAGDKIYWDNIDDEHRIYTMNLDGTNITAVEQASN